MTASDIQSAFNAGEISPELYGAVSLAKYSSAATTMRNMLVAYRGGAISRAGTALVGRCKQSVSGTGPPRPIPFQFSITQGYILEFGDQYLRFVFQGGYVLENPVSITGATNANPCQISVTGTPFANGDWVFAAGVGGMTQLNGNTYIVAGAVAGHFTLQDLNGNAVNSSAYGVFTAGGTVSRLYTLVTPYAAIDLPYLKFTQAADVMSLTCSNPITGTEYAPYSLTRMAGNSWTLAAVSFGAGISAPAAVTGTPHSSTVANTNYEYVVTAVDAISGEESAASTPGVVANNNIAVNLGSNTISYSAVAGASNYRIYGAVPSYNTPVPVGAIHGYLGNSLGLAFTDSNITPDYSQVPPLHANPFAQGAILNIPATAGGTNYDPSTISYVITTSTGSGFDGTPVVVNGKFSGFFIRNGGKNYRNTDTIAINDSGGGLATGVATFTANPADTNSMNIGGIFIHFATAPAPPPNAGGQFIYSEIENTVALTVQTLANNLNASNILSLTVASYTAVGNLLNITYKTPGTVGNAFVMSTVSAPVTFSAAHLTGGGTAGAGATGTITVGPLTGTFPGVVSYFQQRLFYANSMNNPDTFWASKPGSYANFDASIPTTATDAITASPWTEQVNGVQWLVPMPGGLIALTGLRAWQIIGQGSYQLNVQPITPSTTQAQPQAFNGCSATVPPIVIDYDVLYVQAIGNSTVYDLSWNFVVNIYTGADLTILSSHLFLSRQIQQWAWARQPYKVAWASCDDGTLLSITYLKDQAVYGWARHDTQGLAVGIASVSEPPVNAVYMIVQRFPPYAPSGIYVMERMDNRVWNSVEDVYAVDSGVSNPMAAPAAALFASAASGSGVVFSATANVFSASSVNQVLRLGGGIAVITGYSDARHVTGTWSLAASNSPMGLPYAAAGNWTMAAQVNTLHAPHLAGMTIVGLADGVPLSNLLVAADGTVTLPFLASNVKVGLVFLPQLQTPYLNGQGVVQGARKVIPAVTLRLAASGSCQTGTNQPDGAAQNPPRFAPPWTGMATADTSQSTGGQSPPVPYTSPGGQQVMPLWTGDLRVVGDGAAWVSKGQVAVQQILPLPLEILSVEPEYLPGDIAEVTYQPKNQGGVVPAQAQRGPGRWMLGGPRL